MKRQSLFAIIVSLVCTVALWAAISRDFSQGQCTHDAGCGAGTVSTHTFTNATASNSNRFLLAFTSFGSDTEDTTSVKFNTSESLTNLATASIVSADFAEMQAWYLGNPTATTASVVAVTTGSYTSTIHVFALSGVDTVSPIRTQGEEQTNSGAATATGNITLSGLTAGDFVGDCIRVRNAGGSDPGGLVPNNGTEVDEKFVNGVNARASCSYQTATGSSVTLGWTWTNGSSYAHVAIAIKPLAGGATVTPITILRRRRQ